jgi:hypothetical protein
VCVICECKTCLHCCFTSVLIQESNSWHGQQILFQKIGWKERIFLFETLQWHACSLKFFICRQKRPLSGMTYLVDWQCLLISSQRALLTFSDSVELVFIHSASCRWTRKKNQNPYKIMFWLNDTKTIWFKTLNAAIKHAKD